MTVAQTVVLHAEDPTCSRVEREASLEFKRTRLLSNL